MLGGCSYYVANVADQLHLLASGTRACLAGEVPEVRLGAQVLAGSTRSAVGRGISISPFFIINRCV